MARSQENAPDSLKREILHELHERLRRSLIAQAFVVAALALALRELSGAFLWPWAGLLFAISLGRYVVLRWAPSGSPRTQLLWIRGTVLLTSSVWAWGILALGLRAGPLQLAMIWVVASGMISGAGHALHVDRPSHCLFAGPLWLATTASMMLALPGEQGLIFFALYLLFAIHQWRSVEDRHGRVVGLLRANQELRHSRRKAEAGLEMQQSFLANMSHEIRTPLNGILGMTDLLLRSRLDGDQIEQVGTIKTCGAALLQIINEILDYSKIRSEMLELEETDYDLPVVVEQATDMLAQSARQKGLLLCSIVDPSVPRYVRGDATRIRQVLVNLGANAVKFTGAGEVTIRVTAGQGIGGQRELRFEVRDTGPGIAEETIKNLFQPFVQADPSTTRKHGGTGLGLSISRSLVEKMGGQIACESTPGHGSRFHFEIPFEAPSAPPASQPPPSWGAGAKILVAHERATVREMISAMLRRADLQVERASDPELVLNRIERGEPGVEGYAAVLVSGSAGPRRIAELNRCARGNGPITPPILVLSAAGLRGDSRRYQEMGLAGFLTLPVRHDVLLAHLESCLTGEPLNLVGERREANELSPPASPVADRGPGTVLVIDDNPVNQRVIERMLEQLGRSVRLCSTGEEGLRCWRDVRPALVLCDVQMPDMDGLEVARALRAEENRGEHTPILALTAGTGGNDRENCLEAGMDDYLTKPVSFDTLAAMLERWWPSTREPAESVADGTASRP